jgi:hypothetical protein
MYPVGFFVLGDGAPGYGDEAPTVVEFYFDAVRGRGAAPGARLRALEDAPQSRVRRGFSICALGLRRCERWGVKCRLTPLVVEAKSYAVSRLRRECRRRL